MQASRSLRRILPTDRLYRKLRRGQWDPEHLTVDPQAFIDKYEKQSFYIAGVGRATPLAILEYFCRLPYAQRLVPPGSVPTPEDLLDYGEGIAELPASILVELSLQIVPELNGEEIREDGHVNILNAKEFAIELAEVARALSRKEILSS